MGTLCPHTAPPSPPCVHDEKNKKVGEDPTREGQVQWPSLLLPPSTPLPLPPRGASPPPRLLAPPSTPPSPATAPFSLGSPGLSSTTPQPPRLSNFCPRPGSLLWRGLRRLLIQSEDGSPEDTVLDTRVRAPSEWGLLPFLTPSLLLSLTGFSLFPHPNPHASCAHHCESASHWSKGFVYVLPSSVHDVPPGGVFGRLRNITDPSLTLNKLVCDKLDVFDEHS